MGTRFRIVMYADDETEAKAAARAAFDRVQELNDIMSDWDGSSELSRLSRSPVSRPVPVSADLAEILALSRDLGDETGGAFDVTVGPVVRLWRRARRQRKLPTRSRLDKALASVGHQGFDVDSSGRTVTLRRPGMRLDLGGIAKGYAAREALAVLESRGIGRALVDAGGDLALGAPPPARPGWITGFAGLDPDDINQLVSLADCGVATSGDAYRFVEIDGVRYSHIVDPRTGLGLTRRSSVTVIAPDPVTADALASAFSVMGPARSLVFAESRTGIEVMIVEERDGTTQIHRSAGFPTAR